MAQEFVIRAAGADRGGVKHLVARFPLAFRPDPASDATANAPDLKDTGEWAMGQMEEAEAKHGARGWVPPPPAACRHFAAALCCPHAAIRRRRRLPC